MYHFIAQSEIVFNTIPDGWEVDYYLVEDKALFVEADFRMRPVKQVFQFPGNTTSDQIAEFINTMPTEQRFTNPTTRIVLKQKVKE